MEVTQDVYAWFVSSGMIESTKTIKKVKGNGKVLLDDKTTENFKNAQFNPLIHKIEELFNRFYKTKMTYSEKLHDLKTELISSNSVRFYNWKKIGEILNNFGIDVNDESIGSLSAGHLDEMIDLINKMYTLSGELSKRSLDPLLTEKNEKSKETTIKTTDVIELNQINEHKDLTKTESLLEYFLVSLCKPFNIKTRQAAGLLANNRKYLIQVINKGLKGEYGRILNWYTSINFSARHLATLVRASKPEAKTMCYATISCGMYSRDSQVAMASINLVNQLFSEIGPDFDWFFKEGLNGYIYSSTTHPDLVASSLNSMENYAKTRINDVIPQIRRRYTSDREGLFDMFDCLLDRLNKCNTLICGEYRKFLFDFVLNENKDRSRAISMMCDAWITFIKDIDKETVTQILAYVGKCLKDNSQHNIQMTALVHSFRLMNILGKAKDPNAPKLLRQLVDKLIENYDDKSFKEHCLKEFLNSFKQDPNIPIDIMLKRYLDHLKEMKPKDKADSGKDKEKYDLVDFWFIQKIIVYPRFSQELIIDIIDFYFNVCLNNERLFKIAHNHFNDLIDKGMLFEEHFETCCRFIKSSIKAYLKKPGELRYLDTAYDIINLLNPKINNRVEKDIIEANKKYRIEYGEYSNGLLALLWYYDSHDDLIMEMEEKFAKRYDPIIRTVTEIEVEHKVFNPKEFLTDIKRKRENKEKEKKDKLLAEIEKKKKLDEDLKMKLYERALELGKKTIIVPPKIKQQEENEKMRLPLTQSKLFHSSSIILNSANPLIKPEGTLIDVFKDDDIKEDLTKFDIEKEENREKTAIDTLIKENSKKLTYFYNTYTTELKKNSLEKEITKQNLLRMLRDLGLSDNLISLEELTNLIRTQYGHPLTVFSYDQYIQLLVLLSNICFSKMNRGGTICQHFQSFIDLLVIPKTSETNKLNQQIKDLLNKKAEENKKGGSEITLPPGFKHVHKTKLNYEYTSNKEFIRKFMPENNIVVIDILDEIISKALGGNHFLEPFVKVKKKPEIILTTEKVPNWAKSVFKGCIDSKKELEPYMEPVGNLMNDMLRALDVGRTNLSAVKPPSKLEKQYYEEIHHYVKEQNEKEHKRQLRRQFLKERIVTMKEELEEQKKKEKEDKEREKKERDEALRKKLFKEKEEKDKIKKDLEQRRLQRKENEVAKIRELREKEEKKLKMQKDRENEFLKMQNKKLKDQFRKIKEEREFYHQELEEMYEPFYDSDINIKQVFEEKKEVIEFRKNLNEEMLKIKEKEDVKEVLEKYRSHLETLFYLYCQVGCSKITSIYHFNNMLHNAELREFCSDFMIFGLLISPDQLQHIFKKISLKNKGDVEDKFFLTSEDFILTILYLVLYSKFVPKGQIDFDKSLLDKVDGPAVQSYMDFLGLKSPFNKIEVEEFVCDRRALSCKRKLLFQKEFKKHMWDGFVFAEKPPRVERVKSPKKKRSKSKSRSKSNKESKNKEAEEKDISTNNKEKNSSNKNSAPNKSEKSKATDNKNKTSSTMNKDKEKNKNDKSSKDTSKNNTKSGGKNDKINKS